MPRLLFEKQGNAIWISHLDLMRLFQRSFKRAGLPLTHTKGFNPRPSVSIALPLSVGIESHCELLDFDLDSDGFTNDDIRARLNHTLTEGVRVLDVYDNGRKIKDLALLDCCITLEYDAGIPVGGEKSIRELFARENLLVEKKNKNGVLQQDIIPMIKALKLTAANDHTILIHARICCQNPTLNPAQLCVAIERHLPEMKPDFSKCCRMEILDTKETIFR